MTKKIIALLGLAVIVSQNVSARRHSSIRSNSQNVNVRGTVTSINASVSDTSKTTSDYTKIAPITDAVAKRKCTSMIVSSLKTYCGKNKCKNATEAYAEISLPTDTNDVNETYCANFIESAVNDLWNSYDSYILNETKNCNIAVARSLSAEACYRYVLTNQNEKIVISKQNLDEYCGKEAIKSQYSQISNGEKISDEETGEDLTNYFSKVGNIGFSNLTAYTRLLDGKIDFKTTEFPRDLIQLVNSLKSQGNIMCGDKHYSELYDANIQLVDKTGSIEKRIKEEGILKGGKDWITNQIGVFSGNNTNKKKTNSATTEEPDETETSTDTEEPEETDTSTDTEEPEETETSTDIEEPSEEE